ncbi:MAG: hypothetical protein K0R17_1858 [Rariglobus sp.]|nr:hypothetical protein [Rariglobus sp.]
MLALSALGFGAWWGLSILLHGAFFGLVYVATPPADKSAGDASEFTMRISPDRVREVVEEIRQDESPRFKERVEELLKIKQELDRLNAEKIAQYNEIIKDEGVRVREDLPAVFDQVIVAQKEALSAQESAQKALAAFTEAHTRGSAATTPWGAQSAHAQADAALQTALTAQQNAGNAQQQAVVIQAEIGEQLRLASDSTAALTAQQSAATAQGEAGSTQAAVTGIIRQLAAANQALATAEYAAARQQTTLTQLQSQAAAAQSTLEARQGTLTTARQGVEAARAEAAASTEAAKSAAAEEKKRLAELAKQAAAAVKKEQAVLAKAEQEVRQSQAAAKRLQDSAARQQQKTDEALAVVQKRREVLNETVAVAVTQSADLQRSSIAVQQTSLALQQAANAAITKAITESHKDSSAVAAEPSVLPTADINNARTLADYFKQAQDAEIAVAETFKNVRAAELAAIRKIPLAEALAMTKVATPDRPDLNTAILKQDIASVAGVREQEKAIGAAAEQMASMVALAQRMRELAAEAGANLSVAEIQAQSLRNERMEQLASEDAGAKAKDLSAEMAAAHQAGGVHGVGGGDGMGAAPAGTGRSAGDGSGAPGAVPGITGIPVKNYRPLHGRTVRSGQVAIEPGRSAEWLYVDTWHLIGPWPNPGRKNLNTKFPPETVVNLDAVYQGGRKDGEPEPVRWEFFQMPSQVTGKERTPVVPMIRPPGIGDYEIYYGYTELWFDEPADLWVAIGSDDQSKVWINDLLIWKSGDAHKSWVANEGLRKVHFRKGINRVLYRLENGQNSGGFSFIVCLAADKTTGM